MDLKNKTVMITGASSGIGLACAELFAEAGARLILIARRKKILEEKSTELQKKYACETYNIELDIQKFNQVKTELNKLPDNWKKIDILINNAGLSRGLDKIHQADFQDWEEMIDTNIKGLLYISRMVIPMMLENANGGSVVNVASLAGREVYSGGNVYCATKHAVKALSKGMTIDLNGTGIRVINVDPGLVETEFSLVRFHGDKDKAENVYKGYKPLSGFDIAEIIKYCVSLPEHIVIQDLLITPLAQANATIVDKKLNK